MGEQPPLNFDCLVIEPEAEQAWNPEPEIERPRGKPGEFWNGHIYVSDSDFPFYCTLGENRIMANAASKMGTVYSGASYAIEYSTTYAPSTAPYHYDIHIRIEKVE